MKVSLTDLLPQISYLPNEQWLDGIPFAKALAHGTMSVELFAPRSSDYQTLHEQDELYVIVSGAGEFVRDSERMSFAAGDVIFIPAGMPHRFENFSADFVTWVIFYGVRGGEVNL